MTIRCEVQKKQKAFRSNNRYYKLMKKHLIISTIALLCVACGGGGGGTETNLVSAATSSTTQFIDSPAAGLYYIATPSGTSGTTDTSGNIKFSPNDSVSVYIGGAAGLKLATFTPYSGSQVFVPNFANYLSMSQLMLALDSGQSPSNMDFTNIKTIPTATVGTLNKFLEEGSYDAATLSTARNDILSQNSGLIFKNANTPTPTDAANELADSSTKLKALPSNFLDAFTFNNVPYYASAIVVAGPPKGERLSSFYLQIDKDKAISYSSDDTYTTLEPSTAGHATSIINTSASIIVSDTYLNTSKTISCPLETTITSLIKDGGAYGFTTLTNQNKDGSGNCDVNKTTFQTKHPIDPTFGISTLKGKTLTLLQACGSTTNTIDVTVDATGNYSVNGTICSIRQQGFYGSSNTRNVTNPNIANGLVNNVTNFPGLIRFTPSGYNAAARAAQTPTMLLSKSIDGSKYYFNLSDGGTPGELAGGILKFSTLQ